MVHVFDRRHPGAGRDPRAGAADVGRGRWHGTRGVDDGRGDRVSSGLSGHRNRRGDFPGGISDSGRRGGVAPTQRPTCRRGAGKLTAVMISEWKSSVVRIGVAVAGLMIPLAFGSSDPVAAPQSQPPQSQAPRSPSPAPSKPAAPPRVPARWADWIEPDFPFFSSVVDARQAGPGLPANNVTPRGLVVNLGQGYWIAFDVDLLRVAAVWRGNAVTPKALAPGSY